MHARKLGRAWSPDASLRGERHQIREAPDALFGFY